MKLFRSLTRQIAQWRRVHLQKTLPQRIHDLLQAGHADKQDADKQDQEKLVFGLRDYLRQIQPQRLAAIALQPNPLRRKSDRHSIPTSVIFVMAVVSLTSAVGHSFYNEPRLNVDTIAPQTLRAPESARVEDSKTTEENRIAAKTGAVSVLMVDLAVNQEIYQSAQRYLDQVKKLRQQAGAFPYVPTSILSTETQQYLRLVEDQEWRSIQSTIAEPVAPDETPGRSLSQGKATQMPTKATSVIRQLAILELQTYQRSVSSEDFSALQNGIMRSRQRYATTLPTLATARSGDPDSIYDATLLRLSDADWVSTETGIRLALERILAQGIASGLPDHLLSNATQMQVFEVPLAGRSLAIDILTTVLKPNLVQDPEQTRLRAEQAAQAVEPEMVEIQRGEVIVHAGAKITQANFVLLDHFGMSRREINWGGLLGLTVLISGAITIYLRVEHCFHPGLRRRDHVLVMLLTLSAPLMVTLSLPTTSLPAIGLLIGSFYGSALGATVVGLLSLIMPIGLEMGWTALISSVIGSLVGALMAGRLRSREELALLGGVVGLTQGVLYLLLSLILNTPTSPVWYGVLAAVALHGLIGIAWSIVALGISPYLEHLFDLITPIRLAELSNPNRPLLKRLAARTPGTFQHTLFVSTLAEAAARALSCNVELVRAGTLYHDIGKMHDPLGFIENQMGGPNKHDLLNDPWKSAAIIKKHVTQGLVLARQYRLPKAIQAFIPEHQGTMFIAYFYHQAKQRAQDQPDLVVNDADFRYDGPTPQSRETGIVMLADSCEAALRSLKDATPEEALAMVNRILRARWQDHQMVDSGLTRAEMSRIADIFVRVWQQFNHQRIPYPKLAASPQPSIIQL
jgi:cyclic-di-AMP phosphodiesterase PgpH